MTPRRRSMWIASAAGLSLAGLIVVLANIASTWLYLRADLTQGQLYSLSRSSRELVRGLNDPVIVHVFFSPNLPPPYDAVARYTRDLLNEYRSASRGRIKPVLMPALPALEFEAKASQAGMVPVQINQVGADQLAVRRAFMGLSLYYGNKSETIPLVRNLEGLEYDITTRLARMINRPKKTIAVTTGHAELPWRSARSALAQDLELLYAFKDLTLPATAPHLAGIDAILVAGPRAPFDAASIAVLEKAFAEGKSVGLLLDVKQFMPQQFSLTPQETGFRDWLAGYGIRLDDRLVLDRQSETIGLMQNILGLQLPVQVRYAFMPLATDLHRDHPIMRGVESVTLPFVTRVEPTTFTVTGVKLTPLVRTSPASWLAPASIYNASPDRVPKAGDGEPVGPFTVAAVVERDASPSRLVVFGSSQFLNPQLPSFSGALPLLTNLLAYLTDDQTLLGIRSKGAVIRPLKPVSPGVAMTVRWLCIIGVPLTVVALGLWVWRRRRAWRHRIQSECR